MVVKQTLVVSSYFLFWPSSYHQKHDNGYDSGIVLGRERPLKKGALSTFHWQSTLVLPLIYMKLLYFFK